MTIEFDTTIYLPLPRLDVALTVALGAALLARVPKGTDARVRTAAKRMRTALAAVQSAWRERDRTQTGAPENDVRQADVRLDRAWGACAARLLALGMVAEHGVADAEEVATLHAKLFPNGLAFLKLPYRSEWAESEKLLARIAEEKLGDQLEAIAGRGILAAIQQAHRAYGQSLGITHEVGLAPAVLVAEPLRQALRAIAHYVTQVVALYDPDDDATAAVVASALAPIPQFRERSRRESPTEVTPEPAPEVTPESPLPEVEPVATPTTEG